MYGNFNLSAPLEGSASRNAAVGRSATRSANRAIRSRKTVAVVSSTRTTRESCAKVSRGTTVAPRTGPDRVLLTMMWLAPGVGQTTLAEVGVAKVRGM
jgi:hypothetical protein